MITVEKTQDFKFPEGFDYKLPKGYVPFEEINVCSNKLINVTYIFMMGQVIPLLIGKGDVPLIWLKAFDGKKWISVLEMNKPTHGLSRSMIINNILYIHAGETNVIKASIVDGVCKIIALDLRPLGINIYGNEKVLKVGLGEFSDNTFEGAGVMIGFPEY